MGEQSVDVAIVGSSAAGLMTAIWAGRFSQEKHIPLHILLLDTRQQIGAKILMSGGTRCNVTNKEVRPSDFHGGPSHFVKHILEAFTLKETLQFFKEIGVKLILEPTGKYFPITHSAQTVLDALMNEAKQVGVYLKMGVRMIEIKKMGDLFHLKSEDGAYSVFARRVVLTTGGLSYPTSGSDGTGYGIAKEFGHKLVDTFPALTPLMTDDLDWKSLSGISLEARLSFFKNGQKKYEYQDSFLFTHFGFSGPASLDISRCFSSARKEENPAMRVSFIPSECEESLEGEFRSTQKKDPKRGIKSFLVERFYLPTRFVEVFLNKIEVCANETLGQISNERRKKMTHLLLNYPLEVRGVFGYKKAEVTAGGIDLKEVNVSTMESKLINGLYFAGEILDVDGRIGGFNFQWAWSTGAVAGRSAVRSLVL